VLVVWSPMFVIRCRCIPIVLCFCGSCSSRGGLAGYIREGGFDLADLRVQAVSYLLVDTCSIRVQACFGAWGWTRSLATGLIALHCSPQTAYRPFGWEERVYSVFASVPYPLSLPGCPRFHVVFGIVPAKLFVFLFQAPGCHRKGPDENEQIQL
jgi:hypothetical protein